jgi:hypothetical protein
MKNLAAGLVETAVLRIQFSPDANPSGIFQNVRGNLGMEIHPALW